MAQKCYAKIIFHNVNTKFNKDLTDFLERTIETANIRGRMIFTFQLVNNKELAQIKNQGITKLPAMIIEKRHILGVSSIIEDIQIRIKTSNAQLSAKTDDELIADYQQQFIHEGVGLNGKQHIIADEPENEEENVNYAERCAKESQRRGITAEPPRANAPMMRQAQNQRPNNVEEFTPRKVDPMDEVRQSLKNTSRNANNKEAQQDDAMMSALIDRMGMD